MVAPHSPAAPARPAPPSRAPDPKEAKDAGKEVLKAEAPKLERAPTLVVASAALTGDLMQD